MRNLVLLPGFMCDADLWADMAPDLAKIGQAHFGNVYNDDSLQGMARRVLSESPERFVLVGFSMGGFVARILTLMAPERVTGVAFVASSARGYTPEETERRKQGFLPGNKPPRDKSAPGGGAPVLTAALGLHPDRERDPELLGRLRGMQRRLGPEVRARQAGLVRLDGYADLARIACPSLVVACRQDRLRTLEETQRMAANLPNSSFEIIEDCGHMAPLEKPHELAAILDDWITRDGL
ncbi:MAG: alpha/beta hydrolase [Proteobacteria bacterium]|nr:alpha/beta hydrolase [Pseudomonadota bacterium]